MTRTKRHACLPSCARTNTETTSSSWSPSAQPETISGSQSVSLEWPGCFISNYCPTSSTKSAKRRHFAPQKTAVVFAIGPPQSRSQTSRLERHILHSHCVDVTPLGRAGHLKTCRYTLRALPSRSMACLAIAIAATPPHRAPFEPLAIIPSAGMACTAWRLPLPLLPFLGRAAFPGTCRRT